LTPREGSDALGAVVSTTAIERTDFSTGRTNTFLDGSERTVVSIGPTWIARGIYEPGWRWSAHVGPMTGSASESHFGYVVSGSMVVRSPDGTETVISHGEAWFSGPGHDAWVAGDEPCIALDFPTR
jgi:hypothetical protein